MSPGDTTGGEGATGPLRGMRVVDFTHIFAGPFATQILGDLGAEVIKIERPDGGDASRYYGLEGDDTSLSGPFLALNRNKRSVAVDLSTDEGRALARELILSADIVVENFRAGVMQRWGLDYETLAEERPGLIYCAISGFGRTGALASKAANDLIMQAYSGLLSFTGEPGRPPVRCGTAISDFSAGLFAVAGILAATVERSTTGRGQLVETSLLEAQVGMMGYFFAEYWLQGIVPQPMGTSNRLGMPNQAFETSDGYVVITAANDRMWQRCCAGLGEPDLAFEPRFATLAGRYAHRAEVEAALNSLTTQLTTAECVERLEVQGVSCAPIRTVAEVASDAQLEHLGAFIDVPAGSDGTARVIGSPVHLSSTPAGLHRGVPDLGQDTRSVLEELGFEPDRIDHLITAGVIATAADHKEHQ